MDRELDLLEREEVITEPAKRWRAVAWVSERITFVTGDMAGPGIIRGKHIWPSREIAEQKTLEWIEYCKAQNEIYGCEIEFEPRDPEPVE